MPLRPVLVSGLALVPLWGLVHPYYLLLDELALGPARSGGVLAALAAVGATLGASLLRKRLGGKPAPHRSAWDLAMLSTVAALAMWSVTRPLGRLPYLEGFALALLNIVAGWGCALAAYVLIARGRRRHPGDRDAHAGDVSAHPSMIGVFVSTSLGLALLAAVVLGVGSVGRAAGARAKQVTAQAEALADLAAMVLRRLPPDAELRRLSVLQNLETHGEVEARLLPASETPAELLDTPPELVAETEHGWVVRTHGGRHHLLRRDVGGDRVLWVLADVSGSAVVLAPDDAPGLLLLALLVLAAPLATGIVGRELATDLGELTETLRGAAGTGGRVPAVAVRSLDDIGDLAMAINVTLRAREAEIERLALELEGAAATDRARNRFLAGASHELRTPLNAITGYCHLLQRSELTESQREDITLIEEAGLQLLGHVDEILDLSRIESGLDAPLECRPTDLESLVRQVVQARAKDVPSGVRLDVDIMPGVPRLNVDPLRIRQVLENLVGNALKFTRAGQVQVSLGQTDGGVCVQVSDTGPGIPAEELESIFLEFHRVEGQRQIAGTGLGLAIARRLVAQHGGRLHAESVVGQGSTFHLVLPFESSAGT